MSDGRYSKSFEDIFSSTRNLSNIFGIDVIKTNYRINWRTILTFIVINTAIGFTVYTVNYEVFVKGNLDSIIKSAAVVGTGIQGYSKLVNVVCKQKNFRFLYNEIKEIYVVYDQASPAYREALKTNISLVKKLLITLFTIIMVTALVVSVAPIVMCVLYKKRYEVLPFQFPFIDFETDLGYYLTSGFHINCVLFGGFGNFVIDSWLFIYAAHITLIKNILQCKLKDLDRIAEKHPRDGGKSKAHLVDIFKWHQKYNTVCEKIKGTYFWVIFIQIGTEFVGLICTIVCIFLGIWPPAPAFAVYLFSMIYSYCALGNLVELSNEDITTMIYDYCWYNLTVAEQKMVLIMLRESQKAAGISIGGVAPLSLSTALQLTKTIYTLSMMLKEFLN